MERTRVLGNGKDTTVFQELAHTRGKTRRFGRSFPFYLGWSGKVGLRGWETLLSLHFGKGGWETAYGTELSDVDGDGIPDWMYLVPEDEDSLKLRLGHEKGFGPESSFDLKLSSFPIPLFSKSSEGRQRFCSIDAVSNEALVFSFEKRTKENFSPELKVRSYDLFSESNKQAAWAMDDFDDNGISDLVVTDSSLGELLYLSGKPNGQFGSANEVPS